MRLLSCLVLLVALTALACADDGYFDGIGGSMVAVKKHPTIRMVSEEIHVKLPDCEVAVDFVFKNEGPATTVRMGFPENGEHAAPKETKFTDFKTWVDGKRYKAMRLVHESPGRDEEGEYEIYWVKTVPFKANQTRRVRVEYIGGETTNNGKETNKPYYYQGAFFRYVLTTGGSWKGPIGHVRIVADTSGMGDMSSLQFERKPTRRHGLTAVWEMTNLNPRKADDFIADWFVGFTDLKVNGQNQFPQDGDFHAVKWDEYLTNPPQRFGHEVFVPASALPYWASVKVKVVGEWLIVTGHQTHKFRIRVREARPTDSEAARYEAISREAKSDAAETLVSLRKVAAALGGKYTFNSATKTAYANFPRG